MAVHIEAQDDLEIKQIRSRELQLENTEKLNNIMPIVDTLDNVDLQQVEVQTNEIKEIVNQNLEEQPNIEEIIEKINDMASKLDTLTKSVTQIKKTLTSNKKLLKKIEDKIEG